MTNTETTIRALIRRYRRHGQGWVLKCALDMARKHMRMT